MPLANEKLATDNSLRILVYGPAKSKKTWWACRAAEAGFKVLLFDFEDGSSILKWLPEEARNRIYILSFADSGTDCFTVTSTITVLKKYNFYVNETTRRVTESPQYGSLHIDINSFGQDTFVIFDSYTALVNSAMKKFSLDHKIDLAEAQKIEWPGYGQTGRLLTWMLGQMEHFPCPFVLIGHETQNTIKKKVLGGQEAQKKAPIEMVRRQVYSSSMPHGMSVCKNFSDVLYTYAEGRSFKIDTRGDKQADGGCRNVAPALHSWDELTIEKIAKAASISAPTNVSAWDFPLIETKTTAIEMPIIKGGQTKDSIINTNKKAKNSGLIL